MSSDLSTVIARHRTLINSLGVSSKDRESSVSQSDSISIELGGEVEIDCMSILITYPCCWGALRMDDANSILQCGTKIMWLTHFSSMTGLKESPTLNTWICWWQKSLVSAWGTSFMALFLRRSSTAALVSTIQLWIQMKWLYFEWRGYTLRGEEGVPKVSGLRPVLEEGFLLKAIADGKLVQMLLHCKSFKAASIQSELSDGDEGTKMNLVTHVFNDSLITTSSSAWNILKISMGLRPQCFPWSNTPYFSTPASQGPSQKDRRWQNPGTSAGLRQSAEDSEIMTWVGAIVVLGTPLS